MTIAEKIENIIGEEIDYMKKRMKRENITKSDIDKEMDYMKEKITNGIILELSKDTIGTIIDIISETISKTEVNHEWCKIIDNIVVVQIDPLLEKILSIQRKYKYRIYPCSDEKKVEAILKKINGYQTSKMFKFGSMGQFKRRCAYFDIRYIPTKILDAIKTKVIHE